jgi:glycine dehydrogenase subunit 1
MVFVPATPEERREMLEAIGAASFDDLLSDIPSELHLKGDLDLPRPLSELEAKTKIKSLASMNAAAAEWTSFLGGGAYDHYIPSVVDHITLRSEFYTAYTPYQAEISQGTLQSIYEFQSLMTRLTGMDISNASLYDGGTALAEGVLMANAINRRKQVVVSGCINPLRLQVLRSYLRSSGLEIRVTGMRDGMTDPEELRSLVGDDTCCVILENPNFYGIVEEGAPIGEIAHGGGGLFMVSADPISLGVLAPPGDYGADIVVGEGQVLGSPLSFGGPYLGFMTARKDFIRRLPGRIVGKTVDQDGNTCFCLTLQTREQHIRREKATSNICTNQALMALRAAVYLCWLGPGGIRGLATLCLSKAAYARKALTDNGFKIRFAGPCFREFVVDLPCEAEALVRDLTGQKLIAGLPLGRFYESETNCLLVAFTEKHTRPEIDNLVAAMKDHVRTAGVKR